MRKRPTFPQRRANGNLPDPQCAAERAIGGSDLRQLTFDPTDGERRIDEIQVYPLVDT